MSDVRQYRADWLGFRCDKSGCHAEWLLARPVFSGTDEARKHEQAAAVNGWAMYGGRTVRHYCPEHRPGKPPKGRRSSLRHIWGTPAAWEVTGDE